MLLYDGEMVDAQSQEVWNVLKENYITNVGHLCCERFAFYNGRERWTGLEYRMQGLRSRSLFVVFGENRNSDELVVMPWTADWRQINPPTVNDVPEATWKKRHYFKPGWPSAAQTAALLIENTIKLFVNGEYR